MSPELAIRSATVDAAELLGRPAPHRYNRTRQGRRTIAAEGDPAANVRLLETVGFVIKHGRVHKRGGERQLTNVD